MHNKTSFIMTVYASATQPIIYIIWKLKGFEKGNNILCKFLGFLVANRSMLHLKNPLNSEFTPDSLLFMNSQLSLKQVVC